MIDPKIVVAVVCLSMTCAEARAQAQPASAPPAVEQAPVEQAPVEQAPVEQAPVEPAPASVELSLSVAPQVLLSRLLPSVGGLGGVGGSGLGNLGGPSIPMALDVGIALAPSAFLVVGVSGGVSQREDRSSWSLRVPLSVLFYLEPPGVGRVLPTLRLGGVVEWSGSESGGETDEQVAGGLLAHGGLTWIAVRWFALRAEVGVYGMAVASLRGLSSVFLSLGLEASLAAVFRV